jgi:hypothetical protein
MGIVNNKEQTVTTAIYDRLSPQEKWQISAYGATVAQVREALASYQPRRNQFRIVLDLLNNAWAEANRGELEDARQTLNRAKLAISDWYGGDSRDFFQTDAGRAFSVLSDAQELLEMEDIRGAQMCIDQSSNLISVHEGVR